MEYIAKNEYILKYILKYITNLQYISAYIIGNVGAQIDLENTGRLNEEDSFVSGSFIQLYLFGYGCIKRFQFRAYFGWNFKIVSLNQKFSLVPFVSYGYESYLLVSTVH